MALLLLLYKVSKFSPQKSLRRETQKQYHLSIGTIEFRGPKGLLTVAEPVCFLACMFKIYPSMIGRSNNFEDVAIVHGAGKDLGDGGLRT
ncbi:hypothetical protein Y032_0048g1586 [Ancylostoma ceylanicum]|uniref:Uncharacterized protein n=1 Tax=Ancylostoma ceylanicum TaxID=53326 RepID=A0A016UBV2_9BILA|nr:hypothetical protein Y032_0048g1586 [Ancylostoma ceylanicum]